MTIAAAGHAAATGPVDLGVDALHALTAGLWVGGLVALVALGRSVEPRALHRFSTLAMASVLTLIVTGTLNSPRHLKAVEELWETSYGLTLAAKLVLVASTIAAAAVSRRRLQQKQVPSGLSGSKLPSPWSSSSSPPCSARPHPHPEGPEPASHTGHGAGHAAANEAVQMSLGDHGKAALAVLPATTAGSQLHLILTDATASRYRPPESP